MASFWGVEVKPGVPLRVKVDQDNFLKISQATLGEVKGKGNESIHLFLNVNDQKFVIGTLIPDKITQISYDMPMDRDFELSHDFKKGSIYFCGYRASSDESDDDTDSDFGELPVITKENGETEPTEEKPILTTGMAAAKSKVTIVEPKKGGNINEDDDEDSDEDSDEDDENSDEDDESESQEEKTNFTTEKAAEVTSVEPKKGDNTNEDDDEDSDYEDSDDEPKSQEVLMYESGDDSSDEEDGSSDEDDTGSDDQDGSSEEGDEDTPKKGKKRPAESSTTAPVPQKKAKFVTPPRTDIKKVGEHISTPHPSKKSGKTPANNDKSKQQTPKSAGQVACKSCSKTFSSDGALQSHTKAKHSDGK